MVIRWRVSRRILGAVRDELVTAAYYVYSAPHCASNVCRYSPHFSSRLRVSPPPPPDFIFASPIQLAAAFPGRLLLSHSHLLYARHECERYQGCRWRSRGGIATIPTMFKGSIGKTIIGAMLAIAFLSVPVILASAALFVPSIIAAAIGYYFAIAKPVPRALDIYPLLHIRRSREGVILWR